MRMLGLALVLLLAGCATPQAFPPVPVSSVAQDTPFQARGRISVNYDGKGQYGNFSWNHSAARDELDLLSPLGNTVARISRDASGVQLQSGGKTQQAADVAQLTAAALGWALPLDNLAWWIRGRAAPGIVAASGSDGSLQQQGWQIRFTAGEAGSVVPRRVDMTREGLTIKLVTDQWQP